MLRPLGEALAEDIVAERCLTSQASGDMHDRLETLEPRARNHASVLCGAVIVLGSAARPARCTV